MDPLERSLERRFAPVEPPEDFTGRVMEAVRREAARPRLVELPLRRPRRWNNWALAGAIAASLMAGIVVEKRRGDRRAALEAEAQIVETLSLAGAKINQARERVRNASFQGE